MSEKSRSHVYYLFEKSNKDNEKKFLGKFYRLIEIAEFLGTSIDYASDIKRNKLPKKSKYSKYQIIAKRIINKISKLPKYVVHELKNGRMGKLLGFCYSLKEISDITGYERTRISRILNGTKFSDEYLIRGIPYLESEYDIAF